MREQSKSYFYGIDLIRFAAAASVMVYHFTWLTPGLGGMMPFGWIGVQVFFVISGLVIANTAYKSTAKAFLVSRFLRLYPAAWCVTAIVGLGFIALGRLHWEIILGLISGIILISRIHLLSSSFWTLPVEICFYLFIYLLIRSGRFDRNVRFLPMVLILWSVPYTIISVLHLYGFSHLTYVD